MRCDRVDLARVLRVLRAARGWNQAVLAARCGIHASAISDYERGRRVPEYETLARLLEALDYPVSAIERVELLFCGLQGVPLAPDPGEIPAAAVRLAQEAGRAVEHCALAFMELQAGGWGGQPARRS